MSAAWLSARNDGRGAAPAGYRRTTSRPRRRCSARCCCRRTPSPRWPSSGSGPTTSTSRPTSSSTTRSRTLVSSGEPADAVTVADELRRAGVLEDIGGPGTAARPADRDARPSPTPARYGRIVRDTALLRRLIGVAGEIAEIGYDEPDDVTKALDEAENKVFQLADHQVTDSTRPLSELLGEAFDDLQAAYERGERAHRRGHRLPRPGRAAVGAAARHAEHRRRPPVDGQDGVRARRGDPRRHQRGPAGALLLAGDGSQGADRPHPVGRGPRRLEEAADRRPQRDRLVEDRPGHRTPRRAALPRRQPERHRDGDPRQGPADEGPPRRPRADRRRLPPADVRPAGGREPPGRGQRAEPRPQDPGP